MSAWKDVVTAALLGTEKTAPPVLLAPLQTALGTAAEFERETRFLTSAGSLALWRRAGWKPPRAGAPPVRAEAEEAATVSRASTAHLRSMLAGTAAAVLPEWLAEAARLEQRAPPELLPALLERARQNRALRSLALAAGGRRAQWLARHNPAWSFAAADDPNLWETGSRDQRLAILRALRLSAPAEARARLESAWAAEPADLRAAFLAELAVNLSIEDAPFLEATLNDRSKEVRRAAVELLARLPASPFVARMLARAAPLIVFKRGGLLSRASLEIVLPPEPDAAAFRDGLDPKAFGQQKILGEKAVLLVLIVAAVPLSHWTTATSQNPGALLISAEKNEFGQALATAWALAACRQNDAGWAEALLDATVQPHEELLQNRFLMEVLPENDRAARLESALREGILKTKDAARWQGFAAALAEFKQPWPLPLARQILAALHLAADGGLPWQLRGPAESLLLRLPSALLPDALTGWPADQESVAGLVELLTFRHEALAALRQT